MKHILSIAYSLDNTNFDEILEFKGDQVRLTQFSTNFNYNLTKSLIQKYDGQWLDAFALILKDSEFSQYVDEYGIDTTDWIVNKFELKGYGLVSEAVDKGAISSSERKEIKQRFGNPGCSFARDDKGIYCYTHRSRSKSYESVAKIPKERVKFVESTG